MDDLRNEIRAAFEREQAPFPTPGNLRPTLERPARNYQWVAVAATVLIGVLVVVGLMSSRITNRGAVSPPKVGPTPSQIGGDYGTPPAGVPLVYVGEPNHPGWYTGFDWTGIPRGTIKLAQPIDNNSSLVQAPDGQAFDITPAAKGGEGQFLDRLGARTTSATPGIYGMWADDSRHFCAIAYDQNLYAWTLVLAGSNEATRDVAVVARDAGPGETAVGLVSCSIKNDVAIAVRTSVNYPSEMWAVQISTGKILVHRPYANGINLSAIAASADGKLIAENSISAAGRIGIGGSTVVRNALDDHVVATLPATMGVLAFSADDAYALVTTSPWGANQPVHLAVVELATARTVWQSDGSQKLTSWAVEPTGAGFALMFTNNDQSVAHPAVNVVMVFGSGKTIVLPGSFDHP